MSKAQKCARLLADPKTCKDAMTLALAAYPISAQQHLSKSQGRRPWIGAAACCFALKATEEETRIAWNFYMTPQEQASANMVADELIEEWEEGNA